MAARILGKLWPLIVAIAPLNAFIGFYTTAPAMGMAFAFFSVLVAYLPGESKKDIIASIVLIAITALTHAKGALFLIGISLLSMFVLSVLYNYHEFYWKLVIFGAEILFEGLSDDWRGSW